MRRSGWLMVGLGLGLAGCGEVELARVASREAPACPACPACPELGASVSPDGGPVACEPGPTGAAAGLTLASARWVDLPGWAADRHAEVLPAWLASCRVIARLADDASVGADPRAGRARDWRAACAAAAAVPAGDDAAARAFFEAEFAPYAALGADGPDGKLTGYYVQGLRGSRTRHGPYQVPIQARPLDLVSVELGDFIDDGRGRRIWGRVDPATGTLVRYPSRAALGRAGAGADRVLLWVDDAVDAVFAEIEGSGKVALDDGSTVWIAFDGKNGQRFRGVGGILRGMGELARGEGTMQGVRAWFAAHPGRIEEIVEQNPAKVFFRESDQAGALGTQGVVLTARRSVAVDRGLIALGTPLWLDTQVPVAGSRASQPFRQLVVAQDTGGAILGPVRVDLYLGDDEVAGDVAGRTGGRCRVWLLVPRTVAAAIEAKRAPAPANE